MIDEKRRQRHVLFDATKRIVERGNVVHIGSDDRVTVYGLEHLCDVAQAHRVARLRAPILTGVCEIGNNRGHMLCRGIFQRTDKEQ